MLSSTADMSLTRTIKRFCRSYPKTVVAAGGLLILYLAAKHIGIFSIGSSSRLLSSSPDAVMPPTPRRRGLTTSAGQFFIDGKELQILSGAMHYFRVVPQYWEDRLRKLQAAGLNTVETYVPWNKHEAIHGEFTFEGILNLRAYIQLAQRLGLYVIVRPGPYICSEWDWGGMPSWLLREPEMQVRTTNRQFMSAAKIYLTVVLNQIKDLQYTEGGPIIAFQVDNEYGSYNHDHKYLTELKQMMLDIGYKEMLFTSDNDSGLKQGLLPGVLQTANFKKVDSGREMFKTLRKLQPGSPLMVMEFWSGWFDAYSVDHSVMTTSEYITTLKFILSQGASVNLYMFHGGTNFGFMNGANEPQAPQITSYDYDAPLSESGDLTDKYINTRKLLAKFVNPGQILPPIPEDLPKEKYSSITVTEMLLLKDMISLIKPENWKNVVSMEMLHTNKESGQGVGFTLYRKVIPQGRAIRISGYVHDRATFLVNHKFVETVLHSTPNPTIRIDKPNSGYTLRPENVLDILVENLGRVNYGKNLNQQKKGLYDEVSLDGEALHHWDIFPLELKEDFINSAVSSPKWQKAHLKPESPALFSAELVIPEPPRDTLISIKGWVKGCIFVNGFNIGRYWKISPQGALYVPAPLLKQGRNQILFFELDGPAATVQFSAKPVWISQAEQNQ